MAEKAEDAFDNVKDKIKDRTAKAAKAVEKKAKKVKNSAEK